MSESKLPQRWVLPVAAPEAVALREPVSPVEQESMLKSMLGFVALLRRHWFLVLTITAGALAALSYRLRHELPIYQAQAVIRLEDKGRELSNGISRTNAAQPYRPFTDPVLSQIQVLQSRAVAEEVVQQEGLRLRSLPKGLPPNWMEAVQVAKDAKDDTLRLQFRDDGFSVHGKSADIQGSYGQPVSVGGVQFTVPRNPGLRTTELTLVSVDEATDEVRGGLSGRPRERTDVIDVTYSAADPNLAERVVNSAVQVFQTMNAATAKQESVRRRQFIAQQLDKVELMLADARSAHNAFRSREKVYSSQEKFKAQQADLTNIDVRRQELVADRQTYTTLLGELERSNPGATSAERLSALAASPGVATNSVVSQLFTQLVSLQSTRDSLTTGKWGSAPTNPDVQRLDALIASAASKVVNAVRANITVIDARVSALDRLKGNVSERIASLPSAEAQEQTLLAQVETYSRQVDRLRDELQSAEIAEAAEAGQVGIVDLATLPGAPIGTGRRPKMALALMLGLALGMAAAYVVENYRPVIRRRDELEETLSLPNLALVPQIRLAHGNGGSPLLQARRLLPARFRPANGNGKSASNSHAELITLSDVRSSGAEAYRTLRTNLLFSAAVSAMNRIVVTSPGPEEGKSTTAANLAIAFAQQGHRVLLIDCDLRRARLHKIFGETQLPGLTNVLVGGQPLADAIRPTKIEGLMVLPSGALPPNPAELLGSGQMKALLETLSSTYDLLILDTPPLLAASDAAIVSRMTDGALVVVRAGRTERSALQTAIQQLATVGARVLGTVLNDPDAEVPKYARYYGYYYNNYYNYYERAPEYTNGVQS